MTQSVAAGNDGGVPAAEPDPGIAATVVDRIFFAFSGVAAIWFAVLLLRESLELGHGESLALRHLGFLVVFWAALAYLVLPRLYRILSLVFIPNYFMGRTRTNAGLFGDAVNLAFLGTEEQLRGALDRAGWKLADPVTLASSWRIVSSTLLHRSYSHAPVSPLLLFDRQQDFAYEQEVHGNPRQRHHVRFWRCPEDWMLPGGVAADWVAAASFDRAVGLSLFTLQITHRVGENIDAERDYLVSSLQQSSPGISVDVIKNFSTGYHSRNGGGDSIETDGDLPVTDLSGLPDTQLPAAQRASPDEQRRNRRPPPTVFGAVLVLLRGAAALTVAAPFLARFADALWVTELLGAQSRGLAELGSAYAPASVILAAFACVEAVLAILILRGSNIARLTAMSLSAAAIILQIVAVFAGPAGTLGSNIFGYSFDILLILALSSSRARIYARSRGRSRLR
ncbi:hypothetical protein ABIB35_000993 [Arthrobacter sp. UYP6]|uniref:LssY C-terminal domain-containing protein n=1 Tax=Arthrobacter sp. UYP6 TaxID=1756378 RepID=UPI003396CCF8